MQLLVAIVTQPSLLDWKLEPQQQDQQYRGPFVRGIHTGKKVTPRATVRVMSISPLDIAFGSHCEVAQDIFPSFVTYSLMFFFLFYYFRLATFSGFHGV